MIVMDYLGGKPPTKTRSINKTALLDVNASTNQSSVLWYLAHHFLIQCLSIDFSFSLPFKICLLCSMYPKPCLHYLNDS